MYLPDGVLWCAGIVPPELQQLLHCGGEVGRQPSVDLLQKKKILQFNTLEAVLRSRSMLTRAPASHAASYGSILTRAPASHDASYGSGSGSSSTSVSNPSMSKTLLTWVRILDRPKKLAT